MARRKALSAELDPRIRQLVAQLRQLKDHTGLSTRQLAAKTGYSEKSWERYLLGRSLPPREAVEALSRIGGVDPVRLLALHEVAAAAWGDRRVNLSAPEGPAGPEPSAEPAAEAAQAGHARLLVSPSLRVALVAGVVALVLAVSSTVLLVLRLDDDSGEPVAAPPGSSSTAGRSSPAPVYSCRIKQIAGLWYAGISRTRTAGLATGDAGPDVAEAQCLLRRAGISPGGIDGIFGPLTRRAVRAVQKRSGLEVDGMIGPHTWKVLRG
ncbi:MULTISPECIES: peptidoglycan-binding protein [Streptomyces]|uniref:Peptidoglycan-binding protein n=2 Tax=Streptomyces TaxID=1883 RepID=A0ABV9IYM6_9ACTN